jgi:hypothetical protein
MRVARRLLAGAVASVLGAVGLVAGPAPPEAKAKVSVSASLTQTNSSTVTHNWSRKISANKYGHAQYVSWGKKVTWVKYADTPQCTTKVLGRGTIKFPMNQEGWRYWETAT